MGQWIFGDTLSSDTPSYLPSCGYCARQMAFSLCTLDTHYDWIHEVGRGLGFRVTSSNAGPKPKRENFTVVWTDEYPEDEVYPQRYNKIPGLRQAIEKCNFSVTLNFLQHHFPTHFTHWPRTFILPEDMEEMLAYCKKKRKCAQYLIAKPTAASQGDGITIFSTKSIPYYLQQSPSEKVVQRYVAAPHLIGGRKYDLRMYLLVTGTSPPEGYLYQEGIARFCTSEYAKPDHTNLHNVYMHLTNYSLNKGSDEFDEDEMKRPLSSVEDELPQSFWADAVAASRECLEGICGQLSLVSNNFQLVGMDILVDAKGGSWILEANGNPSLLIETPTDDLVKRRLMRDTLQIVTQLNTLPEVREIPRMFLPVPILASSSILSSERFLHLFMQLAQHHSQCGLSVAKPRLTRWLRNSHGFSGCDADLAWIRVIKALGVPKTAVLSKVDLMRALVCAFGGLPQALEVIESIELP